MAYTNAVYYVDLLSGTDAAGTALISCTASNPSGSITRINKTGHGLVTGAVVDLTLFSSWLNTAWKITVFDADNFDLDTAVWQATADTSGTVTPRNAHSMATAWKTLTYATNSARAQYGDTIAVKKSDAPTSLGITAKWTGISQTKVGGGLDSTINITSSTNATPIEITATAHSLATGDVVHITGHTTNTNANGIWLVTYVSSTKFTLDGSVGNGVGGASGTMRRITPQCVVLASEVTKTVDLCQTGWTAGTNCTVTHPNNEYAASNDKNLKIVTGSSTTTARIIAQKDLGSSQDFSGYQQISFNIRLQTTATTNSGDLKIRLYSDGACTLQVESFDIPAISLTANTVTLTINKGSALSSGVQGVAIYTNISYASKTIYIDDIIACKATSSNDSLTLNSLISKESTETGATHDWFAICGIVGKIVVLNTYIPATTTTHRFTYARGYWGTTETVTTYKRECIKVPSNFNTSVGSVWQSINAPSGTGQITNLANIIGGYNSSGIKDGLTIVDTQYISAFSFLGSFQDNFYVERLYCIRFTTVMTIGAFGTYVELKDIGANSCGNGISIAGRRRFKMSTIYGLTYCANPFGISSNASCDIDISLTRILSSTSSTLTLNYVQYLKFVITGDCSNNAGTSQIQGSSYVFLNIYNFTCNANLFYITYSNNIYIYNIVTNYNGNYFYANPNYNVKLINPSIGESTEFDNSTQGGQMSMSSMSVLNLDTTANNNFGKSPFLQLERSTTERHTASGYSIKATMPSYTTYRSEKTIIEFGPIMVTGGVQATASVWVKKSNITTIDAKLICKAYSIHGVTSDIYDTTTASLLWQELSIQFTPTSTMSVILFLEIYAVTVTNSQTVYIDDFSITQ